MSKKKKSLALNTIQEEIGNQADDNILKDKEFAYLVRKFRKFFKGNFRNTRMIKEKRET